MLPFVIGAGVLGAGAAAALRSASGQVLLSRLAGRFMRPDAAGGAAPKASGPGSDARSLKAAADAARVLSIDTPHRALHSATQELAQKPRPPLSMGELLAASAKASARRSANTVPNGPAAAAAAAAGATAAVTLPAPAPAPAPPSAVAVPKWLNLSSGRAGLYAASAAALIAVPVSLFTGGTELSAHPVPQLDTFEFATVALADGGLKLGAVRSLAAPDHAAANELHDTAWLFGAYVSGGRLADAYAMLSAGAQRALPPEQFKKRFGETRMLLGSNDVPWRIPGSNVFLFSLSEREVGGAVKGEARLSFAVVDGRWQLVAINVSEATPEQRAAAR